MTAAAVSGAAPSEATLPEPARPRLLDVNVLLALVAPQHVHHASAHAWLAGVHSWATTPFTEAGLVRLVLNPAVMGGEYSGTTALDLLRGIRAQPGHVFVPDDASLASSTISLHALVGHHQVTDLHLVGLAAAHGLRLATFDVRLAAALAPNDRRHVEVIDLLG